MNEIARQKLVDFVAKTSYEYQEEPFQLASGSVSNHYVDCKMALSHAEARDLLGQLVLEAVADVRFDAVGGLELGAYPIALAVSDAAHNLHHRDARAFIIRKNPKTHGRKKHIEGDVTQGDRVLIVDDVITRGDSIIKAISKSREEGFIVVGVVAIVDRNEDRGRQNIEAEGVWVKAVMTLDDLIAAHHKLATVHQ